MRFGALVLAAAGLAATAVVVLARGDDRGSSVPATAADGPTLGFRPPAGGSWAANADAACATLLERFHAAMHPGGRDGVQVLTEAARLGHTDLAIFEGSRPPAKSRQAADVIAAALAVQVIALEELAAAEDESNEARARIALDRARDARRRARPYAESLSLTACAREASRR